MTRLPTLACSVVPFSSSVRHFVPRATMIVAMLAVCLMPLVVSAQAPPSEPAAATPAEVAPAESTPAVEAPAVAPPAAEAPAASPPAIAAPTANAESPDSATTADVLVSDPLPMDEALEKGEAAGANGAATPETKSALIARRLLTAFGALAALITISTFLAVKLSRVLRLPDHTWRIGVVSFSVLFAVLIVATGKIQFGIDLLGGHILIYEVESTQTQEGEKPDLNKLVVAVTRRVNPGGVNEVVVRRYGEHEIEVQIPKAGEEELESIMSIISKTGALEFRILANRRDHLVIIDDAMDQSKAKPNQREVFQDDENGNPQLVARWVPVVEKEAEDYRRNPDAITRVNSRGRVEVLVVQDEFNVTGQYLLRASAKINQSNDHCVNFSFDRTGGQLFGDLTMANLPDSVLNFKRQLAILLDNELISAPTVNGVIFYDGEITGKFTEKEASELAQLLTAGSLPAALVKEPTSKSSTGPSLGREMIRSGVQSMIVATLAVIIFMLVYYRFAGVVANVAVLLNVLLTVAFMILFKAAFTLSGLAGLALTVGMSVDANVLIYERIREELNRGASLRMAIRNGFERATTTIIDSNLTTLITAVVLFVIGTDQVKGFAVTLILGILMNLFTAIIVSRLIFDAAEKNRWITQLNMMQILSGPNFDFVGKRKPAVILSMVLIVGGIVAIWQRGSSLLDIDFTGGTSVQVLFVPNENPDVPETRTVASVRDALNKFRKGSESDPLPNLTVTDQDIAGEKTGLGFRVDTSNDSVKDVEAALQQALGSELVHNSVTLVNVMPTTLTTGSSAANATEDSAATAEAGTAAAATTQPVAGSQLELQFAMGVSSQKLEAQLASILPKDAAGKTPDFQLSSEALNDENAADIDPERLAFRRATQWTLSVALPVDAAPALVEGLKSQLAQEPFFPASSRVGSSVAGETQLQALYAIIASLTLILAYVWFRFSQVAFGFAAIAAVVHDVLITLGALAASYWLAGPLGFLGVEQFKINLPIVAAFLALIGYSLNDTIVIFDRIRELRGKSPRITEELINRSINQTLSRTILTTLTTFLVVVLLYTMGGSGIHGFAFALLVGLLAGTYSTVFVATPILLWLNPQADTATSKSSETSNKLASTT